MRHRLVSWLADNALNGLAYVALHFTSPPRAKAWVGRVGHLYPPLRTVEDAQKMTEELGSRGTCLSRSLAIAARYPGSQVVIGVAPRGKNESPGLKSRRALDAHAWIEVEGVPLVEKTPLAWVEIGRLAGEPPPTRAGGV
jgi:hypothetical protein